MLENEPNRYDELKKAQEAAQQQPPAPTQAHPREYEELKTSPPEAAREPEKSSSSQPEPANIIDDTEAKMTAYSKEQQIEFEAGRITRHEQIRREKLYDQQLTSAIQSTLEGKAVALPDPQPAVTTRQQQDEGKDGQGQIAAKAMDWERMQTDPVYRKQMEAQAREERAQRQQEKGSEPQGPQRPGSNGRER